MLTRTAGFPTQKTLQAYDLGFATGASRGQIQELASLSLVERARTLSYSGHPAPGRRILPSRFGLIAAHTG